MKIFAHRGISAHYPENSQTAISQCNSDFMAGVEIDLFQASEQFVVIHDRWLTRLFDIDKKTTELTSEDLANIKGNDNAPLPNLHWLLNNLVGKSLTVNIELKQIDDIHLFLTQLTDICQSINFPVEDIIISSFNHVYLRDIAAVTSKFKLGLLMATNPLDIKPYLAYFPIFSVHLCMDCVSADLINQIKQFDLEVYVFTVDHPSEIQWCYQHGVDGIFSNDPQQAFDRVSLLTNG